MTALPDLQQGSVRFSVDSALLRELGERLVGKPHIALAELVKNAYDADATKVVIRVAPDRIEVSDNGHGMNFDEFQRFWMRIGTPAKQHQRVSRSLSRPLTGSKGVGRLAVQFLARHLQLHTVSVNDVDRELIATVDWDQAVVADELTNAEARFRVVPRSSNFPDDGRHGTTLVLTRLNQGWDTADFRDLAQEIWWLQPPFKRNPLLSTDEQKTFEVVLDTPDPEHTRQFVAQMQAYLNLWFARLVGRLVKSSNSDSAMIDLLLEFKDGERLRTSYPVQGYALHHLEFEIRVFLLKYRQAHGISVHDAREYLKEYGGVHIYDAGFHLPYYGLETDWLNLQLDHSRRLSRSALLPESLHVPGGMEHLPTNRNVFGVVHIDTATERSMGACLKSPISDILSVQVTRDRLADNDAFEILRRTIRWALDFYAVQRMRRELEVATEQRPVESPQKKYLRVESTLERFRPEIPPPVFHELERAVEDAISASTSEAKSTSLQISTLGPLATAGVCALAYEHEIGKELHKLEHLAKKIREITNNNPGLAPDLSALAQSLEEWVERARSTRALFSHLMDTENRTLRQRFRAVSVVRQVQEQMGILLRGIEMRSSDIDSAVMLPEASFAEWSAILQNVLINAANAMLDSSRKLVQVSTRASGLNRSLIVQDTGVGIDLASTDELFRPFTRKLELSPERRALGMGGMGLGLSIVRMIAGEIGCRVTFVQPDAGFSAAFEISWRESDD